MAFDISNTRVSVGVFESERLCAAFSMATDQRRTPDEYGALLLALMREYRVERSEIDGAIIGSVVPPVTEALSQLCQRGLNVTPLCVGAGTRTGIRVATHHPREVGTDRIVNAVAAHRLFGGPAIVVDFGTATSFDVVADDGAYLGSVIAPGLGLSADALFERTSRLPRVDLVKPAQVIGKDTVTAVQSGLVLGHVAMVDGIVSRIEAEIGTRHFVLATGELASLVAAEVPVIRRVEPQLTLTGLRIIYELNHGR